MKVIIVGGGVGGCTAALFLKRIGVNVVVYEGYNTSSKHVGAGLGLASNGLSTLALYSEDIPDKITARGYKAGYYEMRDSSGSVLGCFPGGREGRYGKYGTVMTKRWEVHEVLLESMQKAGITIQYGRRVIRVEEDASRARVIFEDNSTEDCDLLIGADGAHSIVRATVSPNAKVQYSGLIGVGGFLPRSSLSPSLLSEYFPTESIKVGIKGAIMSSGREGFFGMSPVDQKSAGDGGEMMWWSSCVTDEKDLAMYGCFDSQLSFEGNKGSTEEGQAIASEEMKKCFSKWHEPIPTILKEIDKHKIFILPNNGGPSRGSARN